MLPLIKENLNYQIQCTLTNPSGLVLNMNNNKQCNQAITQMICGCNYLELLPHVDPPLKPDPGNPSIDCECDHCDDCNLCDECNTCELH